MRQGLFTFRAHPSDVKILNKEIVSTLQPLLEKSDQYILSIEEKGKPSEHIHLLFTSTDSMNDASKVKQKIESKSMKQFIKNRIPETMTQYEVGFNYQIVKNDIEDQLYTTGYCGKEHIEQSKGYDQDYVTKAVTHYHTHCRNESKIIKEKKIKTLKPNEVLTYMEDFVEKNELKYSDPYIFTKMRQARYSFVQVSKPQREILKNEFILMNEDKVPPYDYNLALDTSNRDEDIDNHSWRMAYYDLLRKLNDLEPEDVHTAIASEMQHGHQNASDFAHSKNKGYSK